MMIGRLSLVLPLCLPALGCLQQPLETPALLDVVLEDRVAFRPRADSELLAFSPGTPIDALEGHLEGCWGKVLDDDGRPSFPLSEALRLDSDGTYERWQYMSLAGVLSFLSGESGTYEVLDSGRLRVAREHLWGQGPGGTLEEQDVDPLEQTALVTLSASSMLFVLGSGDPNAVPLEDRIYYIYQRFECP